MRSSIAESVLMSDWLIFTENLVKLVIAVLTGIFMGQLRDRKGVMSGQSFHIFIAMSACFMTLSSLNRISGEPGEAVLHVAVGMGIVGAGVIIGEKGKPNGIKTALTLWLDAAFGVAVGAGLFLEVAAAALLVFLISKIITR